MTKWRKLISKNVMFLEISRSNGKKSKYLTGKFDFFKKEYKICQLL